MALALCGCDDLAAMRSAPGNGGDSPPIALEGGALPGICCKTGVLVEGLFGGLLRKLGAVTVRACVLQNVAE